MERPARYRGDGGETLVEVLVAVVILGLAGVAVLAGMALAAKASAIHRKETTGGAQVRTYAENIQSWVTDHPSSYVNCATPSTDGTDGTYRASVVGFTTPSGFKAPTYTVKSIGRNSSGQVVTLACSADVGLQQMTLTLASNDGQAVEKLTFVLRRPCDTSVVTACS